MFWLNLIDLNYKKEINFLFEKKTHDQDMIIIVSHKKSTP